MMLVTRPVSGSSMFMIRPERTTQEMKFGRYRSVCETFLNFMFFISFIISARMIGIGKPHTIFRIEM